MEINENRTEDFDEMLLYILTYVPDISRVDYNVLKLFELMEGLPRVLSHLKA